MKEIQLRMQLHSGGDAHDQILYPQYDPHFDKELVWRSGWARVQVEALRKLGGADFEGLQGLHSHVLKRWLDVAAGRLPNCYDLVPEDSRKMEALG